MSCHVMSVATCSLTMIYSVWGVQHRQETIRVDLSYTIRANPILSYSILSCAILSYPILSSAIFPYHIISYPVHLDQHRISSPCYVHHTPNSCFISLLFLPTDCNRRAWLLWKLRHRTTECWKCFWQEKRDIDCDCDCYCYCECKCERAPICISIDININIDMYLSFLT
jgi:hypothetical protein